MGAWESGDAETRQRPLRAVFEAVDVENGEVVGYVPRSDRAAEIVALSEGWQPRSERDSAPQLRNEGRCSREHTTPTHACARP